MRRILFLSVLVFLFAAQSAAASVSVQSIQRQSPATTWSADDRSKWKITFSESVQGFTEEDISLTAPSGVWEKDLTGAGAEWFLDVWRSSGSGDGALQFEVQEGQLTDSLGDPGPFGEGRFSSFLNIDTASPTGGDFSFGALQSAKPGSYWSSPRATIGGQWVASAQKGSASLALASNGALGIQENSWTVPASLGTGPWSALAASGSQWMALSSSGETRTSSAGFSWSPGASLPSGDWVDLVYYQSNFWALSSEGLLYKLDAGSWQEVTDLAGSTWKDLDTRSGRLFALRSDGNLSIFFQSSFSSASLPVGVWSKLAASPGALVAAGPSGQVARSADGISWQEVSLGTTSFQDLIFWSGNFFLLSDGTVFASREGTSWQSSILPTGSWKKLIFDNSLLLALAPDKIVSSYRSYSTQSLGSLSLQPFVDDAPFTSTFTYRQSDISGGVCLENWGLATEISAETALVKDKCYLLTNQGEDVAGTSTNQMVINSSDTPEVTEMVKIDPVKDFVKEGPLIFKAVFSEEITALQEEDVLLTGSAASDWSVSNITSANNINWIITLNSTSPQSGGLSVGVNAGSAADLVGNTGPSQAVQSEEVTIDVDSPAAPTWSSPPKSLWPAGAVSFSWVASESGEVFCALDSQPEVVCNNPVSWSSLSNGSHTISLWQEDLAGNRSEALTHVFTVDNDAPAKPTITGGPAQSSFQSSSSATLYWEGEGSSFCSVNSQAEQECSSPLVLSNLSEGSQTVSIRAKDAAGNFSSATVRSWTVDTVKPSPPTLTTKPNSLSASARADFTWMGEAWAEYRCQLDGGGEESCPTTSRTYTGLQSGQHQFSLRQKDRAGNWSDPVTWSWEIILEDPPQPSWIEKPPSLTNNSQATFVFSSVSNDPFQCSLNGEAWAACTSPYNLTVQDGGYSFRIRQINAVNRTGPSLTWSWSVDTVRPTQPVITAKPLQWTSAATASFAWTGELGARAECSLNNSAWQSCAPIHEITGLSEGAQAFRLRLVDSAGNISPQAEWQWNKDATPPAKPTSISGTNGSSNRLEHNFSWSGESGATFQCSLDGAPWDNCSSPLNLRFVSAEKHTLLVRQKDIAGNVSESLSYTWIIDLSKPAPPEIIDFPGARSSAKAVSFSWIVPSGLKSECRVDAAWQACRSPWEFAPSKEGRYTFSVRLLNDAGTTSDASQRTWLSDWTPPKLKSVQLAPLKNGMWRLKVGATEAVQIAFAKKKGAANAQMPVAKTVRLKSAPRWARVSDSAGNWSNWIKIKS